MLILVSGGTTAIDNLRKHPLYARIAVQHIGGLVTPRTQNDINWYLARRMQWACDNDCFQQLAREDNWFLILQFVQDCSNGWYGEEAKQAAIQVLANYFGEE